MNLTTVQLPEGTEIAITAIAHRFRLYIYQVVLELILATDYIIILVKLKYADHNGRAV
jgi:hypothetical protein